MARLKTLKLPKGVEIDEVSNDNFFTHPSAASVPTTLAVKDYLEKSNFLSNPAIEGQVVTYDGEKAVWANPFKPQIGREVFKSSGTFFVPEGVTAVDVLVVAGGGCGGPRDGTGGGGAGGLVYVESYPVTPGTSVPVIVGAGGRWGVGEISGNGGDSSFGSIVAIGGGRGGSHERGPAASGGSGGGGGSYESSVIEGGSGTPGQGNDGGDAKPTHTGGGGGGAGAAGSTPPSSSIGGDGGAGLDFSAIFGADVGDEGWFAGGGGGGAYTGTAGGVGGKGGGGDGTHITSTSGMSGLPNTGGGGGGCGWISTNSAPGGSGVVIVRWGYV